MSISPSSIRLL
jgi:hypothetical protein